MLVNIVSITFITDLRKIFLRGIRRVKDGAAVLNVLYSQNDRIAIVARDIIKKSFCSSFEKLDEEDDTGCNMWR